MNIPKSTTSNKATNSKPGLVLGRYRKIEKIGEGSYGIVYKAIDTQNKSFVALKRIRLNVDDEGIQSTTIREASILKSLEHENIVKLHDVQYTEESLYMIFEYLDFDLRSYMLTLKDRKISRSKAIKFTFDLLKGLAFMHERRFIHRDLKPQNILIGKSGELKIADFGLARAFHMPMGTYTDQVVTLWYRPPEVLLGAEKYNCKLDIWGVACIFAEMLLGKALFRGDCEIDQLFKIFQVLGAPTEKTWPKVKGLSEYSSSFEKVECQGLPKELRKDKEATKFLYKMLICNPVHRMTAEEALADEIFNVLDSN